MKQRLLGGYPVIVDDEEGSQVNDPWLAIEQRSNQEPWIYNRMTIPFQTMQWTSYSREETAETNYSVDLELVLSERRKEEERLNALRQRENELRLKKETETKVKTIERIVIDQSSKVKSAREVKLSPKKTKRDRLVKKWSDHEKKTPEERKQMEEDRRIAMNKRENYTKSYSFGDKEYIRVAAYHLRDNNHKGRCERDFCKLYEGSREVAFNYTKSFTYTDGTSDVTLIATATYNRLQFIPALSRRWDGPICVSIWSKEEQLSIVEETIQSMSIPSQVVFVIYHVNSTHPNYYDFPVNYLRNICIRQIKTTHFLVLDVDMWPTSGMHHTLVSLPPRLLNDPKSAVIIPPIFLNAGPILKECRKLHACFEMSKEMAPSTKTELIACVDSKNCLLVKVGGFAHLFVLKSWLYLPSTVNYVRIVCFPQPLQEPYLMLKLTKELPLFDERFVNYGYNKIQYVEHLKRYVESFFILTNDFAVDMVHRRSTFANEFKKMISRKERPEMDIVWGIFRHELFHLYRARRRPFPICSDEPSMYAVENTI